MGEPQTFCPRCQKMWKGKRGRKAKLCAGCVPLVSERRRKSFEGTPHTGGDKDGK